MERGRGRGSRYLLLDRCVLARSGRPRCVERGGRVRPPGLPTPGELTRQQLLEVGYQLVFFAPGTHA